MKLLIQTIADRFGYFIMKKATLDKLTNELAETKADLASLREQNRAFRRKKTAQNSVGRIAVDFESDAA
jgi:hypothetical protein